MTTQANATAVYTALTRNIRREHGFEAMTVEGRIPSDLAGTLYRVGPGLFERFGQRVNHPFEADGAMSAVRITEGRAEGAVRVVRGRGFQEEERAGRHLYSSRARLVDRLPRALRGHTKNVANTSPVLFQDRLFAQVELSLPTELSADLEPFWTWHIANAFEDGEGLAIDLSRYPDLGSLEEIGSGKKSAPPKLERLSVSAGGAARFEHFADLPVEFPVVRPERVGHRHRFVWCQTEGRDAPSGILRVDTETGALDAYTCGDDEWLGEPVLAPVGEAEDDAYVLTHCLDRARDRTCVTVLRADRLADGPVCKLWFDAPLPISFHGAWARELPRSRSASNATASR